MASRRRYHGYGLLGIVGGHCGGGSAERGGVRLFNIYETLFHPKT